MEYYLASKPVAPGVSARLVARKTPGFAGAQIANMINEAALAAAKQGATQITTAMLDEARDKVMMGKERSISRTVVRRPGLRCRVHRIAACFFHNASDVPFLAYQAWCSSRTSCAASCAAQCARGQSTGRVSDQAVNVHRAVMGRARCRRR